MYLGQNVLLLRLLTKKEIFLHSEIIKRFEIILPFISQSQFANASRKKVIVFFLTSKLFYRLLMITIILKGNDFF